MRRGLVAAMLPVLLCGCLPVIPPAISLATTGFSGLALFATGKTPSDYVISAAADEDCSMLRVVFGDQPCRAYDDESSKPMTELVAYYPGDADDWVDRESIPKGTMSGTTIMTASLFGTDSSVGTQDADTGSSAALLAAVEKKGNLNAAPSAISEGLAPLNDLTLSGFAPVDGRHSLKPIELQRVVSVDTPLDLQSSQLPSWSVVPDVAAPVVATATASAATGMQASAAETMALPVQKPGSRRMAEQGMAHLADHFVMLGSFRDLARAEHLKEMLDPIESTASVIQKPVIMSVRLKGNMWHRVAVGPFTGREAIAMASALGPVSGKKAWAAKVTN